MEAGLPGFGIALIVTGVIVVLIILILITFVVLKKKKGRPQCKNVKCYTNERS